MLVDDGAIPPDVRIVRCSATCTIRRAGIFPMSARQSLRRLCMRVLMARSIVVLNCTATDMLSRNTARFLRCVDADDAVMQPLPS